MGRDLSLQRAWRKRMRQQERSGLTSGNSASKKDLWIISSPGGEAT